MKKIIILGFLSLILCDLFAEDGNCVRYKVGITLKDNKYIEGFVFEYYNKPKFSFADITIKDYIINNSLNQGKIVTVYLNITQLIYPKFPYDNKPNCEFHLNATIEEDVKKISTENILEIKLLEYNTCYNCDKYDIMDGFNWVGINPIVITELTTKEIKFLQTEPNGSFEISYPNDEYSSFKVLSYNKAINSEKLKNTCEGYLKTLEISFSNNDWTAIQNAYKKFKDDLRTKDVIVFEIIYSGD